MDWECNIRSLLLLGCLLRLIAFFYSRGKLVTQGIIPSDHVLHGYGHDHGRVLRGHHHYP